MADENAEVKDVERVEVVPTDDEETIEPETTDAESSQQETEGESESDDDADKPDEIVARKTAAPAEKKIEVKEEGDGLKEVPGETPRERAMRLQIVNLRRERRQERAQEIFTPSKPAQQENKIAPEVQKVLEKYKPEEIQSLREVLPALAEEMGFVRKDQLGATTFAEKAQEELDTFLDKHPEYSPENDPDGTFWSAFRNEYQLYKQPGNPKDFKKIFDRVHRDVFGIQAAGSNNTVKAAQEKAKAASHAGTSTPSASQKSNQRQKVSGTIRTDMLKGFSPKEIAALEQRQGE